MKVVMTLVTEYFGQRNQIDVHHLDYGRQHGAASFEYNGELSVLENHELAARRWLELRGSDRTLIPYAHKVNGGYYFGMV